MNYTKAVDYIENIPRFAIAEPLEHAKEMMRRLGDPQNACRTIHVAGTNGKGSVCAYLASMLEAGGFTCGLFTSPHLVKVNERFKINGEMIGDDDFLRLFNKVKTVIDQFLEEGREHPSFFEVVFAVGALYFQEQQVDYVVLETGLGGRLDATNAVAEPEACVITSISLEHTEYLGDTVEQIAAEKAGIIKTGVPVIYDGSQPDAAAVIAGRTKTLKCPAFPLEQSMYEIKQNTPQGIDFSFYYKYDKGITISIPYIAPYQMVNASLALLTMLILKEQHRIPVELLKQGIAKSSWEGRMETILPGVIVDGAHNEDGVKKFAETASMFSPDYRITILFSAVADKRYQDMIETICREIRPDEVITTQITGERMVAADELARVFLEHDCKKVQVQSDVRQAFEQACEAKQDGLLFCVGSLYLVGEIKEHLDMRRRDTSGRL